MSTQILASSSSNDNPNNIVRPTKSFHPHIWGERFLHYNISQQDLYCQQQKVEELKEVVRREIFGESSISSSAYYYDAWKNQLKIIDVVERLGLSYHFESEIENKLQCIYNKTNIDDEDLHHVSLRFRLLRQHGFRISSDIFEKFKDEDGNFKKCLVSDTLGLLSLYEATHLSCVGENILDEALAFTTTHLTEFLAKKKEYHDDDDPLSKEISRALERPLRKTLVNLHARHFISIYEKDDSHNKVLLQLAKLDFNLLQCMHKKELSEVSRWWKESDFVHKFPFARDRIVELYLWILGVYYEPQYCLARNILLKIIALASIADDIYDAYGTLEELELLTHAIERWDINCVDTLNQEYMQTFYKDVLNCYEEFEQVLEKEEQYKVHYAKEAVYVNIIYVFEWLSKDRKIIRASVTICRLMDDIAEHKFEEDDYEEHSAVECYMIEHGVCEEEAYDELNKLIMNAWKEINEEFLKPTKVASPILLRALNFSRVMDLIFKFGDGYTHVGKVTKDIVAALLIHPISL
ncbi:hypothetical protein CsatB_015862 [Cannabis sativa]